MQPQAGSTELARRWHDELAGIAAAGLLGFKCANTERGYDGDRRLWLGFCAEHRIDPRSARRAHVDAWERTL